MKLYLVILIGMMVSGCYQTVSLADIISAEAICKVHNSTVIEIQSHAHGGASVVCSNRVYYNINSSNLKGL